MFRILIAITFVFAAVAIPDFAEAGGPIVGCRNCNSELGAPITGGLIFGGHHPHDQPIGAPITGGLIFGAHHPHDQPIGAPITGGLIFGHQGHHAPRAIVKSTPILERPNRPFHFYGNSARRAFNNTNAYAK